MMRRTIIRLCLAIAGVAGLWGEAARGGSVWTRDGRTSTGKLEFKAGNRVLVTATSGQALTIPFQEVVRLSMADTGAEQVPVVAGRAGLALPWRQSDVGGVKEPGRSAGDKGVLTLHGAGWGIWGAKDSFHYVYQPLLGDGDAIARISEPPTEENPFLAGLSIRQGLEAESAHASVMMFPDGGLRMSCRPVDGSSGAAPPPGTKPYRWVRLVRAGDRVSGFCSADGESWVLVGTVKARMSPAVFVGLACAATLNQGLVEASFDHVKITASTMGPAEGLGLVDGSLVAGRVKKLDGPVLRFTNGFGTDQSLPVEAVANVFMRPLPPDVRRILADRKEGVSLVTGDEIEGSIRDLNDGRLTVTSLILGRQTPPLSKVIMAVLRPVEPSGGFSVSARDGSVYRSKSITLGDGVLTAEGGMAGTVTLTTADLVGVDGSAR